MHISAKLIYGVSAPSVMDVQVSLKRRCAANWWSRPECSSCTRWLQICWLGTPSRRQEPRRQVTGQDELLIISYIHIRIPWRF